MKKMMLAMLTASSLLISTTASAAWMYIDVGTNAYDTADILNFVSNGDADSKTGLFDEFNFNQLLATSIYKLVDGELTGEFFDTNDQTILSGLGIPTSGTAMDLSTTVTLALPNCPAQCDIDALSPLIPPINEGQDGEGFLGTWNLLVTYYFEGVLTTNGPQFNSGYFKIFFDDKSISDANDRLVLEGTLTGSTISPGNLQIRFDITDAASGFLWINDGNDNYIDPSTRLSSGNYARFILNTNVIPPIPEANQLLVVGDNAIRQTRLNGSVTATIPEPMSIAIFGLGLLGLVGTRRLISQSK